MKTHANRHAEGNTNRAHGGPTHLTRKRHEPDTQEHDQLHRTENGIVKHGNVHPRAAIDNREDTGEGMRASLTPFERSQDIARATLSDKALRSGVSMFDWGKGAEPEEPREPDYYAMGGGEGVYNGSFG
jgi:hypothetical protein